MDVLLQTPLLQDGGVQVSAVSQTSPHALQ
jgi:hypothetical protein